MRIVFLDRKTVGDDIDLRSIKRFGELVVYDTTPPDRRKERIKDADIVITNKVVIDREILKSAKSLKLICVAATGVNNIDLDSAKEFGVVVKNVTSYSAKSVAQHTFAMLFYLLEQLRYYDEFTRSLKWYQSKLFTSLDRVFWEIDSKIWGIVGLGEIGAEVAKIANAFGCEVIYYSSSNQDRSNIYKRVELNDLLQSSDIISIHTPLNNKTKNLISTEEIGLLKDRAIVLNLARGGIVDEDAISKALDIKDIYYATDVTSIEPLSPNSPLYSVKNSHRLLITPHIAWSSYESRERLVDGIAKNIQEFIENLG